MESSITELVKSVDVNLFIPLFQAMIAFFIVLWIKNYITSLHAWLLFKNSLNIGIGTWIRLQTTTGFVDGQIRSANRNVIEIDTKDLRIFVPTKSFRERDWALLKKEALDEDDPDN